jgi:hypothetical protein
VFENVDARIEPMIIPVSVINLFILLPSNIFGKYLLNDRHIPRPNDAPIMNAFL